MKGALEELQKQLEYLYPKVMEAMKHPVRRQILSLLSETKKGKLSFSELKGELHGVNNATLSHHLRLLQMADLVARTVKLEERYKNPDPYYCYYHITSFGRQVAEGIQITIEKATESAFSTA